MPVDLVSRHWFMLRGVMLEADHLAILESHGVRSRIWRVPFGRVTRVVIMRSIPWVRMILTSAIPLVAAVLCFIAAINNPTDALIPALFGMGALLLATLFIAGYLYYGQTRMDLFYTPQKHRRLTFIARPGKIRRFTTKLLASIHQQQAQQWDAYLQSQPRQATTADQASPPAIEDAPTPASAGANAPIDPPGFELENDAPLSPAQGEPEAS